jgi:hypothetical protein
MMETRFFGVSEKIADSKQSPWLFQNKVML